MKRCEICGGYYGKPKSVAIGEKCCFVITTSDGRAINYRMATGKLKQIINEKIYAVVYRRTTYYVDLITHPDDPSPINILWDGNCICPTE
ncbi:hypothetical protein J8V57_01420 [Xenorhabdus sp. PB61.4]|uniref:hypothetical protein n=1 Tax=Xenorhabdus sp. PB61.4 TaxID=2788940 RepID=UPI001E4A8C72|nr:hypothetical protein [Xenorhabdus sp. PB61.4]MCC8364950.1 hypothetical protein [Xenorhabdus sp. PB61.4]